MWRKGVKAKGRASRAGHAGRASPANLASQFFRRRAVEPLCPYAFKPSRLSYLLYPYL